MSRFSIRGFALVSGFVFIIGSIVLSTGAASARPNLQLVIKNEDPNSRTFDITAQIGTRAPISLGTLSKTTPTINYPMPCSNGDTIVLTASFPQSAIVDTQKFTVQNSDDSHEFDITVTGGRVADGNGFEQMFSDMGQPNGFGAQPLSKALDQLLGGMALVNPSSQGTNPVVIHAYTIRAALNVKPIDQNTIHFSGTTTAKSSDVSSDVSTKAGVTLAFLGSWQVGFSDSSLNQFSENVTNLGATDASPTWDIGDAITALQKTLEFKTFCATAQRAPKGSYIVFVDTLYGVQSGTFSTKSSSQVSANTALTGNMVVSGDAAFTYADTDTSHQNFSDEILNADGSPYSVVDVCGGPTPQTTAVTTTTLTAQSLQTLRAAGLSTDLLNTLSTRGVTVQRTESIRARFRRIHPAAKVSISKAVGDAFAKP